MCQAGHTACVCTAVDWYLVRGELDVQQEQEAVKQRRLFARHTAGLLIRLQTVDGIFTVADRWVDGLGDGGMMLT
jgi:hypothetical protein